MYDYAFDIFEGAAIVSVIAIVAILIGILIAVGVYILGAIGLYGLAKNNGHDKAYLAFIPFANRYLLGDLVGEVQLGSTKISNVKWLFLIGTLSGALNAIPFIGWLIPLAFYVFFIMCMYKFLQRIEGAKDSAVVYTVLCALGLEFIVMLIIKNKKIEPAVQTEE